MRDEFSEREDAAEIIRKKYRYRQLLFSGRLVLPHKRAAELLGPDCMYQLYGLPSSPARQPKKRTLRTRRARKRGA